MSSTCPFYRSRHNGVCTAQGTYIPSLVEKESYCCTGEYSTCALFDLRGNRNIRVMYHNGTYGTVEDFVLDELIEEAEIKKFCRLDGWVHLGCDPIRVKKGSYRGRDKRKL